MKRTAFRRTVVAVLVMMLTAPALAVGLGPLKLDGMIDGPRKGFQLDIFNPYPQTDDFVAYAVGPDDEIAQSRVSILPADVSLGSQRTRKLLVVVDQLAIGETYRFRVCAQRRTPPQGIELNARVCSKLSAHRVQ